MSELTISPTMRLDAAIKVVGGLPFGPTDCALPMLYAKERGLGVDTFIVTTDNETWVGDIHPYEALEQYRAATGIDARLIVLATSATRFSIANPEDAGCLTSRVLTRRCPSWSPSSREGSSALRAGAGG